MFVHFLKLVAIAATIMIVVVFIVVKVLFMLYCYVFFSLPYLSSFTSVTFSVLDKNIRHYSFHIKPSVQPSCLSKRRHLPKRLIFPAFMLLSLNLATNVQSSSVFFHLIHAFSFLFLHIFFFMLLFFYSSYFPSILFIPFTFYMIFTSTLSFHFSSFVFRLSFQRLHFLHHSNSFFSFFNFVHKFIFWYFSSFPAIISFIVYLPIAFLEFLNSFPFCFILLFHDFSFFAVFVKFSLLHFF